MQWSKILGRKICGNLLGCKIAGISQKILRNEKKLKIKFFSQECKTGKVLERSWSLPKNFWDHSGYCLAQNNLEGILVQFQNLQTIRSTFEGSKTGPKVALKLF